MEFFANLWAQAISIKLGYDNSKRAVLAYGLIAILQIITISFFVLITGLLFHTLEECFIIFLAVGILRKSTGGTHAHTMEHCIIISIISITLMSLISINISILVRATIDLLYIFQFVAFILYFVIAYKKAPVDTPNKPITSATKKRRLRRQGFITLFIYLFLSTICIYFSAQNHKFFSYAIAINFSILWQLMTLTKFGESFIKFLETSFHKIFKI